MQGNVSCNDLIDKLSRTYLYNILSVSGATLWRVQYLMRQRNRKYAVRGNYRLQQAKHEITKSQHNAIKLTVHNEKYLVIRSKVQAPLRADDHRRNRSSPSVMIWS